MSAKYLDWNPPRIDAPLNHLSAGRLLSPQRYVIGWPDGIVKIGETWHGSGRWARLLARGGQMIDLANYAELSHSTTAEAWLLNQMSKRYPRAFKHKSEAVEKLGLQGGGYLECFAIPSADWEDLKQIARSD